MAAGVFTAQQRAFLTMQRVGHLATADTGGRPHVVPVCYAFDDHAVYIALDAKPKRVAAQELKRVRNIRDNPQVALVVDRYDEDWTQLAYLLIRGIATLLDTDMPAHQRAIVLLRERYPQYHTMPIEHQPVVAIEATSVIEWASSSV